jgi:HK97 family phage major capsid protein
MTIPVYTAMLSQDISRNLLEDEPGETMRNAMRDFNEAATLAIEDMILNGTGTGQPAGILQNPGGAYEPAVILSGVAANINADSLKKLPWEVPAQYRRNGVFVFNSKTAQTVALFKDTTNNYIWKRGLADLGLGSPTPVDTLDGFPIVYSEFAPNIGAANFPVVFGDLQGYYLILRAEFSITVLQERKALLNQVTLLGRLRVGGDVARPWMLKVLKSNNT